MSEQRHLALLIELPSCYTDDVEEYREYERDFASESEWLLNLYGEPSVVRLRMEVSGEKDSSVEEVWGSIVEARLIPQSPGFDDGGLTEAQLAAHGWKLLPDPEGEA